MEKLSALSLPQLGRLANAFAGGTHLEAGSNAVVSMSANPPLYRIAGVYASEADRRKQQPSEAELLQAGWTRQDIAGLQTIHHVPVPALSYRNVLLMIEHTDWTEPTLRQPDAGDPFEKPGDRPELSDIRSIKITVESTKGTWSWNLPPTSDSVFITRGSAERILFPYYAAVYGLPGAEMLRTALYRSAGDSITP